MPDKGGYTLGPLFNVVANTAVSWFSRKQKTPTLAHEAPLYASLSDSICIEQVDLQRANSPLFLQLSLRWEESRVGLIGNNGSGKSSLVRLLNGLITPQQGRVSVFGYDTVKQAALMPALVGFIFQNPDHQMIFPTVAEELAFGCEQLGQSAQQARVSALALLTEQGIASWADRPVTQLSEGQKQRVCILSVLIMKPRLLILDEPFSSLDLPTRRQLLALIHSTDMHVLLISHDLSVYADFDRLIWVDEGQIKADGAPDDVIRTYLAAIDKLSVSL
ncbi:energy-coupling factor ABC transporter ATP-binding protein [Neptunomonas antarctica]|uniref:Biotin transport system ATP-binding protein n=1 Tax=Neptunomonas antarctica TaxID=619304 RepID=A0A1N7IXY2_9GAMM|nr:ABC transporter ATP-binding protein [Neptunomonas antarctica]SIS41953.1 biotin transport system ATP-binding protein [Neptunomonas antarctica]